MWKTISEKARKRDKFTCYKCNAEAREVHHILPKLYLSERLFLLKKYGFSSINDQKNLITLCQSCHMKVENDFINLGVTNYVKNMINCAKSREIYKLPISN